MNEETKIHTIEKHTDLAKGIALRVGTITVFLIVELAILFLTAGRIDWVWPWVYAGLSLGVVLINGPIMLRTSPEMVAERGQPKETKGWDKIVSGLLLLFQYIALPVIAGLDERFGWTGNIRVIWNLAGAAVFIVGNALASWAMIVNAYFSTAVRIQEERGHRVCSDGPYHYIRHPGYVGFILQYLGTAVLLGSLYALIPGGLAVICMIIRTALEDRTLQTELPGYKDYSEDVRYRLVPGIW